MTGGGSSSVGRKIRAVASALQVAYEEVRTAQEIARVEHERKLLEHNGSLGLMLAQTAAQFEEATAVILRQLGYQLTRVGKAGDLGADLVGTDAHGRSVIVQCKRYAPGNKVGTPAVQSFIGMHHRYHQAAVGVFVTTSSFTAPALELARQCEIVLIDGEQLVGLVRQVQGRSTASGRDAR